MALAIFGAQVLKESSVTGTVSNRIKGKNTLAARPKLNPQRFLALKGFFYITSLKQSIMKFLFI